MRRVSKFLAYAAAFALFQIAAAPVAFAAPILGGNLATFAVLGAAGVTNVPTSTIGGNLGSAPNASVGGGYVFTAGSLQANTALAQQAQVDLDAAIVAVNAGGADFTIAAGNGNLDAFQAANGGTLAPGTYDVGAGTSNLLTGITLNGGGSSTAVWRFRFSSTFIMSEGSDVNVLNIGDGSGVGIYWSVGSAATLDGDTLVGNVLARQLISSNGGLTLGCGRLASAEAQVTLIQDTINAGCAGSGFDQGNTTGVSPNNPPVEVTPVPEPGTILLLGSGLAAVVARRLRKA